MPAHTAAVRVIDSGDRLGECPIWDERAQALWWVDIHGPAIKRYDGQVHVFPMPEPVGSIAFRAAGGLLVALQSGLYRWTERKLEPIAIPASHPAGHRFNDGRCDRAGRFWVGSLKEPDFPASGCLYVLQNRHFTLKREGLCIPNSLAWSPDGRTMYFADSPRHRIWAYDYDAASGAATNERVFAAVEPGFPDGSCVDADGCLWNAEYGAGRVVRYTPGGKVDRIVELPAKEPTCCCFGGARLDTLYVTTANGSGVFAAHLGVQGLPETRFEG
jgi:sugar lactone lactonase YvrE